MGRGKCRWMMNQFCKKQWHFANLRTMTVLRIKNPRYCFTLRFPMTTLQLVWVVTLTQLRNPNRPYVLIRKNVRKINLMRASFFWQKIIVWEIRIFYWNFKSISPPMVDTCSVLLCFKLLCFVFARSSSFSHLDYRCNIFINCRFLASEVCKLVFVCLN